MSITARIRELIKVHLGTDCRKPAEWHSIEVLMSTYAKEEAIAFGKWLAGGILPDSMENLYNEYQASWSGRKKKDPIWPTSSPDPSSPPETPA